MKRILLATLILCGINYAASAQTSGNSSTNSPSVSSSRTDTKTSKSQTGSLNQRKVYHWKDGQKATPTGHEATGTGGSHAPMPKDSAAMQGDSTRHDQ